MEDKDFIGQIFPQKCGDNIKVIEKIIDKKHGNKIFYKGIFINYPLEIVRRFNDIKAGIIDNPIKREQEFINQIWKQKDGDLKILSRNKDKKDLYYYCKFIDSEEILCKRKDQIIRGGVENPNKEVKFFNKLWPQNCGDTLKIIEKSNKKQGTNSLYKCQFIKYSYEIFASKNSILKGSVINPQIEQIEFIDKEWPQHCGDTLKVIKKTKEKRPGENNFLYLCEFKSDKFKILCRKQQVLNGIVNNPNFLNTKDFPYKTEISFYEYLKKFKKKPLIQEVAIDLNISVSHLYHIIQNYKDIESKIHFLSHTSYGEKELFKFISDLYDKEILTSSRKIMKNKEIDIYLPDLKLGFEFNGNYWHSELFKDKNYHREKTLLAKKNNIRLIHIFEYEWNQNSEKIKLFIKNLLIEKNKIGASKCKIKELDTKEYIQFCEENHLQGSKGAKIKLGLFYKDELVQIMSFGKPRFTDKYEWEIIRECSKLEYIIIGGKEKLWSFFVKNYSPNSVISYCDFSKFTGESYLKLGFKLKNINEEFVWWDSKSNICYWRNPYKHKEMKDKYIKIWKAGQMIFEWFRINKN